MAFGSSMNRALWKVVMVSACAIPGAMTFLPPEYPAMKCGSTRPVAMRMSASTNRLSRRTTVPRDVVPTWTWSSSFRAKWLTHVTVSSTQASPTSSVSSAPSFGRWRPVATSTVMPEAGTPPSSSARTSTGRLRPFGTGRVMSQIRMHAVAFPFANSANGDSAPSASSTSGESIAAWIAAPGSSISGIAGFSTTVTSAASSISTASFPFPNITSTLRIAENHPLPQSAPLCSGILR